MKYFILLAMSLVLICFTACSEECDESAASPDQVTGQVGDAVSETSADVVVDDTSADVEAAGDTASDVAEAEDAQPEAVSDTAAPEDTASSSD